MTKFIDALNDLNDIRDRMADPTDTSPRANVGRATCDAYGSNPAPFAASLATIGASTLPLDYACGPYWDDQGYDEPVESPPFSGGQCAGTIYTVSTIRGDDTGLFRPQVTGLVGPITAISYEREPIEGDITRTFIRMDVTAANGSFFDSLIYLHAPNSPPSTSPDVAATSGPDDCGNPSPQLAPGANPPPNTPLGSPFPRDTFGSDRDYTVGTPTQDPYGNPHIPVDVDGDPWYWVPDALPSVPGIPEVGDRPPIASDPFVPAGDVEDEPVDDRGDEFQKCIAVTWNFDSIPANRGGVAGSSPVRYYETFASIQVAMMTSEGTEFWSDQILINTQKGSVVIPHESLEIVRYSLNWKSTFGDPTVRFLYTVVEE